MYIYIYIYIHTYTYNPYRLVMRGSPSATRAEGPVAVSRSGVSGVSTLESSPEVFNTSCLLTLLHALFDSAGDGDIQVNDAPLP